MKDKQFEEMLEFLGYKLAAPSNFLRLAFSVDLRGKLWNSVLADLKVWAEFCRSIKEHSGRNDQLPLAA